MSPQRTRLGGVGSSRARPTRPPSSAAPPANPRADSRLARGRGAHNRRRAIFATVRRALLFRASLAASALARPYSLNCSHSRMSRWLGPERLVRAYKSQPGAVASPRKTGSSNRETEDARARRTDGDGDAGKGPEGGAETFPTKRSHPPLSLQTTSLWSQPLIREARMRGARKKEPGERGRRRPRGTPRTRPRNS